MAGGVSVYDDGDSKLKIGGKIFSDVTSFKSSDGTGKITKRTKGARVSRGYLTTKYYFNSDWMMRITTDVNLDPNLNKKNNNIFLKYAYLEGKLYGKSAVLRVGQSHTPWIDYEQGLWKHRYFSKVLIDTNGYDASSDLGLGLKGTVLDGMAKYFVTYTNGAGYSHPGRVGTSMDIDARVGLYPIKGLTLDIQFRQGFKGTKTSPKGLNGTEAKQTLEQIMATYGIGHDFRLGANYAINKKTPTLTGIAVKEKAFAAWGWVNLGNGFGAFGRFESTKDDQATVTRTTRYAGGLEYSPVKHVTLALAVDKSKTTLNGQNNGKSTRIGLWTQSKF
jgi:hypothetical protein